MSSLAPMPKHVDRHAARNGDTVVVPTATDIIKNARRNVVFHFGYCMPKTHVSTFTTLLETALAAVDAAEKTKSGKYSAAQLARRCEHTACDICRTLRYSEFSADRDVELWQAIEIVQGLIDTNKRLLVSHNNLNIFKRAFKQETLEQELVLAERVLYEAHEDFKRLWSCARDLSAGQELDRPLPLSDASSSVNSDAENLGSAVVTTHWQAVAVDSELKPKAKSPSFEERHNDRQYEVFPTAESIFVYSRRIIAHYIERVMPLEHAGVLKPLFTLASEVLDAAESVKLNRYSSAWLGLRCQYVACCICTGFVVSDVSVVQDDTLRAVETMRGHVDAARLLLLAHTRIAIEFDAHLPSSYMYPILKEQHWRELYELENKLSTECERNVKMIIATQGLNHKYRKADPHEKPTSLPV